MRFAVRDHRAQSKPFVESLLLAGHEVHQSPDADVLLTDHDLDLPAYRSWLDPFAEQGKPIVVYPHGANPRLDWDGIAEPHPAVTACLVPSAGHVEVMRTYGYAGRVEVVGWPWGTVRPPARLDRVESVMFGPIHPLGNGYLAAADALANERAYQHLLGLDARLTVRHVGPLEMNSLWPVDGVTYVQGGDDTDAGFSADVVVATGTLAYRAVAAGKPTVFFAQGRAHQGERDRPATPPRFPARWDDYRHRVQHPIDLGMHADPVIPSDPMGASWLAAMVPAVTADWRARWVGERMDPKAFVSLIEGIVEGAA